MMNKKEIVTNLQDIATLLGNNKYATDYVTDWVNLNTLQEVCSLFTKRAPIMKEFPTGWFPACPHCGVYLSEHHYKCCPDCGQLINWNEYEEESESMLEVDISILDISIRSYIVLKNNNINTIEDLLNTSISQLTAFKNISKKDIDNILGAMKLYNIDTNKWEYELNKERD